MAIYELRTYDIQPGKMDAIRARFRDHTLALLKKHGIEVAGFWERHDVDQLVYLCKFDQESQVKDRWDAFRADPAWLKAKEESERGGPLTVKVTSVILHPILGSALPGCRTTRATPALTPGWGAG
jgi:hypothetical protein